MDIKDEGMSGTALNARGDILHLLVVKFTFISGRSAIILELIGKVPQIQTSLLDINK